MQLEPNEQNLHIKVEGDQKEIIIRHGHAAKQNDPIAYAIEVNLSLQSIAEFVAKRNFSTTATDNKGIILFSKNPDKPFIEFNSDPNDELAINMKAALLIHPDFRDFAINTDKGFNQARLVNFVKAHAHCFESVKVAEDMIRDLRNFEAQFTQILIKEDNRQGEKKDSVQSAINLTKGALPKSLSLRMPLYQTQPPVNFTVEIEVDKEHGSNAPVFSFHSLDIEILKREQVDGLIQAELDKLGNQFPLLETY
jgi:hypothetical protein